MTIPQLPASAEQEYYKLLAKIESNNNPKAKAKTSSASGLYQPIKSTWESYGYDWADVFDVKLQNEFIERFTRDNANVLINAGCAVNFATLYGAHFLGPSGILKVMRGTPTTPITAVTGEVQRKANPSILSAKLKDGQPRLVKHFTDWLKAKTGDDYTKRYTTNGWVSGPGVQVPPEAVIVHEDEPVGRKSMSLAGKLVGFLILIILVAAIVAYLVTR